jgi:hypothetical protein
VEPNTLEKTIKTALRQAWTDSNSAMRYHVCPASEKRFEVVASGNEHETDSVYTTRAAGGDSTKRIKDVAHLRQTARETARDLHESMEREELQRDSNGNQRRIIIHKGIGAVHGHYCNLPANKRIVVSFHDSVAIGELGSGLESR